jgi:2-C-methyl-D-erythritol 4-phosphate cytidylyltransferase
MTRAAAVVVGGGRGRRMGGTRSKLLIEIHGRTVLRRSLEAIAAARSVAGIVLVAPADCIDDFRAAAAGCPKLACVVPGGERRQDSVRAGIDAVPADLRADVILIHDAARPLVTADLVDRVAQAAMETGAAVAAVPVTDTIKRVEQGLVVGTPPRETLWAAQTPQGLLLSLARELFARAEADGVEVTDDVALAERYGRPVAVVEGSRDNIKITAPEDLELAEAVIRKGAV